MMSKHQNTISTNFSWFPHTKHSIETFDSLSLFLLWLKFENNLLLKPVRCCLVVVEFRDITTTQLAEDDNCVAWQARDFPLVLISLILLALNYHSSSQASHLSCCVAMVFYPVCETWWRARDFDSRQSCTSRGGSSSCCSTETTAT